MISNALGAVKAGMGIAPTQQERLAPIKRLRVVILVLGCSGSGKTTLIDTVSTESDRIASSTAKTPTTEVNSKNVVINDQHYELIDTPGFDNPKTSNYKVFTIIAEYLLKESHVRRGMTGVVLVHRAGVPLESRALEQNIRVICEVFLGRPWFRYLTILVVPNEAGGGASTSIPSAMAHSSSAFAKAIAGGARVTLSNSGQADFKNILVSYGTATQRYQLGIQSQYLKDSGIPVGTLIEKYLGYTENESVQLRLDGRVKQLQRTHQSELAALRSSLKESEDNLSQMSTRLQQAESNLINRRDEGIVVHQQLQRTQAEYVSLRSQLQIKENIEQSHVVQTLKNLNRDIENLGRSISEFLVENYVRTPSVDPVDVTTLYAQHLPELEKLLGHSGGYSSLVASSAGVRMRIEDFFDYAIRALLCRHLCKRIFYPFHPGADSHHSDILGDVYKGVQLKEPQAAAGRWRVDAFAAVCMHDSSDVAAQAIIATERKIAHDTINPLIEFFFGREAGVRLQDQHHARLKQLVRTAWEWNLTLKGEILLLGDFEPTDYSVGKEFNSQLMTEFEATPGGTQPKVILATLALGLDSSRAVGSGQAVEVTHVYKAVVATEMLYN